jgi:hypothetical protein
MRIPNQTIGINRKQYVSRMIKGTIYPCREVTRFDFQRSCDTCGCKYEETRRREGGREIIETQCACRTEGRATCVIRKLDEIVAEFVVAPPSSEPDTGPDFTIPRVFTNPFVAEVTSERDFTQYFRRQSGPALLQTN